MPANDPLAENRKLAFLIVEASERVKDDFATAVAPFDVPVSLARPLLMLDAPAPMRALADQLSCDQSYVTGLADDLESRGLVTREPGEDRRVKVLTPTRAGRALRDQLARAVSAESRLLSRLSPQDREHLARILTALVADDSTNEQRDGS